MVVLASRFGLWADPAEPCPVLIVFPFSISSPLGPDAAARTESPDSRAELQGESIHGEQTGCAVFHDMRTLTSEALWRVCEP